MFDIKEPAEKKLTDNNIDEISFPTSYIQKSEKQLYIKKSCSECNKTYASRGALHLHTQSEHKGIRHNCNMCDYRGKQKHSLVSHKKMRHT